jgi:membrane protein implicated in regulation of membrane protease activity
MPPSPEVIKQFLQQASEEGSRSTVLKPLGWMMAILIAATISGFSFCPAWVGILFAVFAGLTMALYLFAYLYFMFTDKDALRSETYSIQKLAIERNLIGDDKNGLVEIRDAPETIQIGQSSESNSDAQQ